MRESTQGQILIAPPNLKDPNFARTVVLMLEHSPNGGMGLVLNRASELAASKVWPLMSADLDHPEITLETMFIGGPVQPNVLLALHGYADITNDSKSILDGVYIVTELEELKVLLERASGETSPHFKLFLGYAGWAPGQLDGEIQAGGWLKAEASLQHVFSIPSQALWKSAMQSLGGVYCLMAEMPLHPENN